MKYVLSSIDNKHSDDENFLNFLTAWKDEAGFICVDRMYREILAIGEEQQDPEYTDITKYNISLDQIQSVEVGKVYEIYQGSVQSGSIELEIGDQSLYITDTNNL